MSTGVGAGVSLGVGVPVGNGVGVGVGTEVGLGVAEITGTCVGLLVGTDRTGLAVANGVGAGVGAGVGLGVPEIAGTRGGREPLAPHVGQGLVNVGAVSSLFGSAANTSVVILPESRASRSCSTLLKDSPALASGGLNSGLAAGDPGVALAMRAYWAAVVAVTDSETRAADSPLPTNRVVEDATIAATTNTAMIEIVTQTTIRRIFLSPIT